jgi:hypothetical protein
MKTQKNLAGQAFQFEAAGEFNKALKIWKRRSAHAVYSGSYVRASEIARIQDKRKLLTSLIMKIDPLSIYKEFGVDLAENLTIEWIKLRGRFEINWEMTPKIVAAFWESDGKLLLKDREKYFVAPMRDLSTTIKSEIKIERPEVENKSIFSDFQRKSFRRVKFESSCLDIYDALTAIGSSSFIVKGVCLVDEFRKEYPQIATRIDDPLILGIRNREALIPIFLSENLRIVGVAFWLGLKYSTEHGHFVSTTLTRLYHFEKHSEWGHHPVVIDSKLSKIHKDCLQLMYPDVKFLEFETGTPIKFVKLIVAPTSVFSPATASQVSKPPDWVLVDTDEFRWLHSKLENATSSNFNLPKKIGIVRKNYGRRKLINSSEWECLAVKSGYSLIDPGVLTAEEEIELFKNATHIIGEIGSWIFLSGLNPDSQIILLTHDKDFIFWNEISQLNFLRRVGFRIVRGRRVAKWYKKLNINNLHSDWKLTTTSKRKIASLL